MIHSIKDRVIITAGAHEGTAATVRGIQYEGGCDCPCGGGCQEWYILDQNLSYCESEVWAFEDYTVTVTWPNHETYSMDEFTEEEAIAMMEALKKFGAKSASVSLTGK